METRIVRGIAALIASTLLLSITSTHGATSVALRSGVLRVRQATATSLPYLAITPAGYQTNRSWPVIIYLHGGDQRGYDREMLKLNGPVRTALNDPDFPFVVIAPQLPPGKIWEAEAVAAFVRRVLPRFRVDRTRVYLTGLSTGGYGTWAAGLKYPELFAAIVPVAGGGDTVHIKHSEGVHLQSLQSLPVWAFHGGSDSVVSADETRRLVSELQAVGARDVRATIFPGTGHDIWNRVYDDPALYRWLLEQHR
jgi:predicted peptidase